MASAFEQELTTHGAALRSLARLLVGELHADDLVQETTLQALRSRPAARSGLRQWLLAVLRRRAANLRREQARRRQREQQAPAGEPAAAAAHTAEQRETIERLHRELMALPEPYRGALLLRFFRDLTPTAIAAATDTQVATVKSRLQRGIAMLRARLGADAGRDRGGWRPALAAAFGLDAGEPAAAPLAAGFGVLFMGTTLKWSIGGGVAALVLLTWPWWRAEALPESRALAPARSDVASAPSPGAADALARTVAIDDARAGDAARPVRLRLVDSFDRAPLPRYDLHVLAGDGADAAAGEIVASDAAGELRLDARVRGAPLTLEALDDRECGHLAEQRLQLQAKDWPAGDDVRELPLLAGPTYELLFSSPPPAGPLRASLIAGTEPDPRAGDARVRAGALPWVRLDPARASASELGGGPWLLTVIDDSGYWLAWGPVQQARGRQATPVRLQTGERGAITISVTVAGGPPDSAFYASAYRLGDDGKPGSRDHTVHMDARHTGMRLELLEPGRYVVYVAGGERATRTEHATVRAGETTEIAVDFAARSDLASLDVVLHSQTGTRPMLGTLPWARRPDGSGFRSADWVGPRADGGLVYRFDALPAGEWDVSVERLPHLPPWDADEKRVLASAGTVEFVCLDADVPPSVTRRVRVVDAAGAPIAFAGVTSYFDGTPHFASTTAVDGEETIGPYVPGRPFQLLVRAAGCLPALVDTVLAAGGDTEPLIITLRRGWGVLMAVVGPGPSRDGRGVPLANVRVRLDGVPAGATDEHGHILLTGGARPARIELLLAGYHVAHGDVDPTTGATSPQEQYPYFVVMEPDR